MAVGGVAGIIEGQPNKMDGKAAVCTGLSVRAAGTRCPALQDEGGETNEMNAIIKVDGQMERGTAQRKRSGGGGAWRALSNCCCIIQSRLMRRGVCHGIGRGGDRRAKVGYGMWPLDEVARLIIWKSDDVPLMCFSCFVLA